MSFGIAVMLVVIVLLLVVAGLLSAAETVLQRLDLVRALAIDDDVPGANDLVWILEHRGSCLNLTLVLTVIVRVATTALAVVVARDWWAGAGGVTLAAVVIAIVSLLGAEIAPRSVTMKHLDRSGRRLAPAVRAVVGLLGPVATLFVTVGRSLAGTRPGTSGPFPSDEPAPDLPPVDEGLDDEIEEDEWAMIRSVVELGDTSVREIMVPRPDMVSLAVTCSLADLVDTIVEQGYSRIPIYRDDREQIVGIVYAKDVLRRVALQPDTTSWDDLLRPPTFVPESQRIDDLLRDLQAQSVHIALVLDEHGVTAGLVTIEDILEEIVGEIVDEHDQEDPLVEVLDSGGWAIDARLPVDDLNELIGASLPDHDWDTVGGLVVGALGRVPVVGDEVELEGIRFQAERVQGRRVAKVLVRHDRDGD